MRITSSCGDDLDRLQTPQVLLLTGKYVQNTVPGGVPNFEYPTAGKKSPEEASSESTLTSDGVRIHHSIPNFIFL